MTILESGRQGCARLIFRADSTLTHMTIQVTQLRLNSNPKFTNLTQLRVESNKSDSRLITFCLIWEKVAERRGGGAVECSCRLVLSL